MDNFDAKVWGAFDCIAEQDDYGDWFTFTMENYDIIEEDADNIYLNVYGFAFDREPITLECRFDKAKGVFIV